MGQRCRYFAPVAMIVLLSCGHASAKYIEATLTSPDTPGLTVTISSKDGVGTAVYRFNGNVIELRHGDLDIPSIVNVPMLSAPHGWTKVKTAESVGPDHLARETMSSLRCKAHSPSGPIVRKIGIFVSTIGTDPATGCGSMFVRQGGRIVYSMLSKPRGSVGTPENV